MKLSESNLYSALNEFLEREIMPLGSRLSFTEQFMFGVKMGIVKRKMQNVLQAYLQSNGIKVLGLVDENGKIDVDTIYSSVSETMRQMGQVDIAGITFRENDLQKLYSIMQRYAQE
jgi:hypothetical protein